MRTRATCVAYETLTDRFSRLPLLTPMSEVAGGSPVQDGAEFPENIEWQVRNTARRCHWRRPGNVSMIGGGLAGSRD
jgi:alanine dehydrogenase